jgi:hypothetical protein
MKVRITPMMISVEKAHERDDRSMLIKKEGKRLKQLSWSFVRLYRIDRDRF